MKRSDFNNKKRFELLNPFTGFFYNRIPIKKYFERETNTTYFVDDNEGIYVIGEIKKEFDPED